MNHAEISIVVPLYKCSATLRELNNRIVKVMDRMKLLYEIIYVNDASPEEDWEIVQDIAKTNNFIRGISLSRNFGQHAAIDAGLKHAKGNWTVVMDGDLQDAPEEIERLYQYATNNYDMVVGKRVERKDSGFRKFSSKLFGDFSHLLTGSTHNYEVGNFGIYSKKCVDAINTLSEKNRSFGLIANWIGFKRAEIPIIHSYRRAGKSSYTFKKLLMHGLNSITSFSNRLLYISIGVGVCVSLFSTIGIIYIISKYILWHEPVEGWSSIIVSIFFSTGVGTLAIGINGLYISKIYDEVKGRPNSIIASEINTG